MANVSNYKDYRRYADAKSFFDEYLNMARLVDDLDTRFWKRFVMKEYRRKDSVDRYLPEQELRKEYSKCVSDLVILRGKVEEALSTVKDNLCHDLIKDFYIRGLSYDEIADKWEMKSYEVARKIQEGLCKAVIPESFFKLRYNTGKNHKKN